MILLAENRAGKDLEVTMCGELTLASSHAPTQQLTCPPLPRPEERVGTAKIRKLVVQDTDSLISEGKK